MRLALVAVVLLLAGPAAADLRVTFIEGAPKDRFRVENVGSCDIGPAKLTIDMSESRGRLIFDTTGEGAGVEVFQPFEVVSGEEALRSMPEVTDGQNIVTLDIVALAKGQALVVSTDLDDTVGEREITVSGSEFAGTRLGLETGGQTANAVFDTSDSAVVKSGGC